ncbi:MAG TPA: FliH/SctL family protein [Terriglobia bacterium]|nr:FliH/SctL family protein [Terriglobia bacterium]
MSMLSEAQTGRKQTAASRPPLPATPFVYPVVGAAPTGGNGNAASSASWPPASEGPHAISEQAWQQREQQAWQRGLEEGRNQAAAEFASLLDRERAGLLQAVSEFAKAREEYFREIEAEVVRLALGIARRILHRESQTDPLVLAGVVRVALEKVKASAVLRLRVDPQALASWETYFRSQSQAAVLPELVADPSVGPDRCVLETVLGRTELSLDGQLKEIEHGFLDLLDRRPGVSS